MTLALIATLPFLGALLAGLAIRLGRTACASVCGAVTLAALAGVVGLAPEVLAGGVVRSGIDWLPALGLNANLMLDGLGLLFALMILGIGLLIILYSRSYLAKGEDVARFFGSLMLFQGAMLGIVLSDNILLLLVFWELTSVASFLLIGYWRHLPEARQGALMALTLTGLGGLALIGGALLLGKIVGSFDLSVILLHRAEIQASPLCLPALLLVLLGCFTKSAQVPFHFWLPRAMAAPTPVSAYLHSATMVKAGIFLLARLWPVLSGTDEWFWLLTATGLATMLLGAWVSLFQTDLKAVLAYSTVSHLGLITMLLGIGTVGAAQAGVLHILNHAIFKAALFMTAGLVEHATHTRDIRRLGGLAAALPVTATIGTLAGLSMAGVPLLNGFLSKDLMLEAVTGTQWPGGPWLPAGLATLGAGLSAACSFRFVLHTFFGRPRAEPGAAMHQVGAGFWLAPALLAALGVAIGLFPDHIAGPLWRAGSAAVTATPPSGHLALWHGLTPALGLSFAALALGALGLWHLKRLETLWRALPLPDAGKMFAAGMAVAVAAGRAAARGLHTGALGRSLAVLCIATLAAGLAAFATGSLAPGTRPPLPLALVPVIGWGLLIAASVAVVLVHRARLLALLMVAVVGLIVSLGFLYFSAPDLALTQIAVEVVTVVLMLLALAHLPASTPRESSGLRRVRDAALAIGGGLGLGGLTYAIVSRDPGFEAISTYHLENAYKLGGGNNVVNVILVDFRGYDTFGEIIVLGIAGLIVMALVDGLAPVAPRLSQTRSGTAHLPLMAVAARVMLPLMCVVAAFILMRGHQEPGGGFVAGLVVSVVLVLQYMASGQAFVAPRLRLAAPALIGAGVAVAAATGLGSWAFDRPFLTSSYGYFTLWPVGRFELATAMLFDLGVFLTVLGATLLGLTSLARIPTPEAR